MKKRLLLVSLLVIIVIIAGIYFSGLDNDALKEIEGAYEAAGNIEIDNDVVLSISGIYLTIYDAGAGNPGVSGRIVRADKEKVTIFTKYFEDTLADKWEEKNHFVTIYYEMTERGILLTNNDYCVSFTSDEADRYFYYLWHSDSKDSLQKFKLFDGGYEFLGKYYDLDNGWIDEGCPISNIIEDNCKFYDDVVSKGEVSQREFEKLLKSDIEDVAIQAMQPHQMGVTELRLRKAEEVFLDN